MAIADRAIDEREGRSTFTADELLDAYLRGKREGYAQAMQEATDKPREEQ